jgi:hypothetical protein
MPGKKGVNKKATGLSLTCSCGAAVQVVLLERIKFGRQLCPHHPERKPCPGVSLPGAISAGCAFFTVVAK